MMFALTLLSLHPNALERYFPFYGHIKYTTVSELIKRLNMCTYKRIQEEVREVLGERTDVTEKDIEKLQYTEQVSCMRS